MYLAHISDLHSGQSGSRRTELWDMAKAIIRSEAQICVVTGDIADNATWDEYHAALGPLSLIQRYMPIEVVPGNHDGGPLGVWARRRAYETFSRFCFVLTGERRDEKSYPIVTDFGGYRFIGLDTVYDIFLRPWSIARGRVGKAQLQKLGAILDESVLPCVVYLHHHPFYRGFALELIDSGDLLATLAGSHHVLLYGHKHEASVMGRMFAADQTPTSRRFRVIDLDNLKWRWVEF